MELAIFQLSVYVRLCVCVCVCVCVGETERPWESKMLEIRRCSALSWCADALKGFSPVNTRWWSQSRRVASLCSRWRLLALARGTSRACLLPERTSANRILQPTSIYSACTFNSFQRHEKENPQGRVWLQRPVHHTARNKKPNKNKKTYTHIEHGFKVNPSKGREKALKIIHIPPGYAKVTNTFWRLSVRPGHPTCTGYGHK